MKENLWPKALYDNNIIAPSTIISNQASLLGDLTKNLVTAYVNRNKNAPTKRIEYQFYIHAPSLHGYRYRLFYITHEIELYPVKIVPDTKLLEELKEKETQGIKESHLVAENEHLFKMQIRLILQSERTKNIISGLVAQSINDPDDDPEIPF